MNKPSTLSRWSLICAGLGLALACCLASCDSAPENQSTATTAPPTAPKVAGGELNRFFPKDQGDYDVIYISEKEGFAQAKLEKNGDELGTLAISDLAGDADAIGKYDAAARKIGSYPAVSRGSKGTAVLVGRFQVQVRSKSDALTASDRDQWLQKFDLPGLEKLAK